MCLVLSINDENCRSDSRPPRFEADRLNYRVQGTLTGKVMTNGSWNYDEEAVYKMLNDDVSRKNYVYARVLISHDC
jgi:hypothetical protein